ncbi:nicotinate-nucleotide--dimethylbenzimidazole phosphoribosyltransferase, partial [Limnohabitans sp. Rim47]
GAEVKVVDIGVAGDVEVPGVWVRKVKYGTNNFCQGPAMSKEEAIQALEVGIDVAEELIEDGFSILATGEMGIGNTTASSAIVSLLTGCTVEEAVGPGTGVDNEGIKRKINAIKRGIEVNKPDVNDALDVLMKVGGLEIAGITGLILGAAANRVPVVIDGF